MSLAAVFILMLLQTPAGPATAPSAPGSATSPSGSSELIRTWFNQLADADPQVREQARISLMGLQRRELPALHRIVAEASPVKPPQAAVLYDIVSHVFMSAEPYAVPQPAQGFLGVQFDPMPSQDPVGIVITKRVAGFCAYRALRDGDIVVGIAESPDLAFGDNIQFSNLVRALPPGTRVTFKVIRNGQATSIPVRLDARPLAANSEQGITELENQRQERANEYWQRNFAKLVEGQGVTSANN